jgi:hypothetical protein
VDKQLPVHSFSISFLLPFGLFSVILKISDKKEAAYGTASYGDLVDPLGGSELALSPHYG